MAGIWGTAAFLKSLDPAAFAGQITAHGITPAALGLPLAYAFIFVEALLAVAHLTFFRPRFTFAGSALLLVFFMGITGIAWAMGNTEGCGCFGRLAARHPREVIIEDAGFLAIAVLGYFAARGLPGLSFSRVAFAVLAPLAIILPVAGPHLPGDQFVTSFNPGEDLSDLAAEDLPVRLGDGHVLLVLLGDSCAACDAGLPALEEIAGEEGAPPIAAVFAGSRRDARAWALEHVPPFGVGHLTEKVLRQYYRRLPQTALLDSGRVVKVWRNRVPAVSEVMEALPVPAPARPRAASDTPSIRDSADSLTRSLNYQELPDSVKARLRTGGYIR